MPTIIALALWSGVTISHWLPGVVGTLQAKVRWLAWSAVVCQILGLFAVYWSSLVAGYPEAVAGAALSLGLAYSYSAATSDRLRAVGLVLAPLIVVLLAVAQFVPRHQVNGLAELSYSPWLPIHLGLMFAGLSGFALASGVGAVYLWVRRRLKQKKLAAIGRLPSLEALDRLQFRSLLFGFVFHTLGIASGGIWAAASGQQAWALDLKVIFTVLIWCWYGAALQVRLVSGRRGRWTALFNIVGFGGLVFSLLGLNFLVQGFHGYG